MTAHEMEVSPGISDARKEVATQLLTAIAAKDRSSASACLADDVTWWVPQSAGERGVPRPLQGREPVLDLLCGKSLYQLGTMKWDRHHVLHDDDIVVVHCTLRANTSAGRPYENQYSLLYRFKDRLVVESWEHTDTAYAFSRFSD